MIDVLQIATNDISISFGKTMLRFDYPWGDDLTGELIAYAIYKIGTQLAKTWDFLEVDRSFDDR